MSTKNSFDITPNSYPASKEVQCPYCWQSFEWLLDESDDSTEMIEDCPICCRPIHFKKQYLNGMNSPPEWRAFSEDEYYE
ncbi:MAG: CPXCG motif-containing cysteine-rich protein [Thiomicrorhabdus sp.]|nr:CPXCG motif-containing cysteine-rich protein [Thiomicrorhabdus sp.]